MNIFVKQRFSTYVCVYTKTKSQPSCLEGLLHVKDVVPIFKQYTKSQITTVVPAGARSLLKNITVTCVRNMQKPKSPLSCPQGLFTFSQTTLSVCALNYIHNKSPLYAAGAFSVLKHTIIISPHYTQKQNHHHRAPRTGLVPQQQYFYLSYNYTREQHHHHRAHRGLLFFKRSTVRFCEVHTKAKYLPLCLQVPSCPSNIALSDLWRYIQKQNHHRRGPRGLFVSQTQCFHLILNYIQAKSPTSCQQGPFCSSAIALLDFMYKSKITTTVPAGALLLVKHSIIAFSSYSK